MILHLLLIAIGILALYFGAVYLVKGSAALARLAGMSTFAIAATVVAFGTSTPELLVTLIAAVRGSDEVALGNIIGSNIANIGLVLGISCLFVSLFAPRSLARRDYPMMLAVTAALYAAALDGTIGRLDGLLLVAGGIIYLYFVVTGRSEGSAGAAEEVEVFAVTKSLVLTVVGIGTVLIGARLLVDSGVAVARQLGVRELVIGLTLVAVGSSLPELATSVVAAFRGEGDITIGNVVGSNIINIVMVLGPVSMIRPIAVPAGTATYEFPVLLVMSVLPYIILKRYGTIPRWAAAAMLVMYGMFVASLPMVRGIG